MLACFDLFLSNTNSCSAPYGGHSLPAVLWKKSVALTLQPQRVERKPSPSTREERELAPFVTRTTMATFISSNSANKKGKMASRPAFSAGKCNFHYSFKVFCETRNGSKSSNPVRMCKTQCGLSPRRYRKVLLKQHPRKSQDRDKLFAEAANVSIISYGLSYFKHRVHDQSNASNDHTTFEPD